MGTKSFFIFSFLQKFTYINYNYFSKTHVDFETTLPLYVGIYRHNSFFLTTIIDRLWEFNPSMSTYCLNFNLTPPLFYVFSFYLFYISCVLFLLVSNFTKCLYGLL